MLCFFELGHAMVCVFARGRVFSFFSSLYSVGTMIMCVAFNLFFGICLFFVCGGWLLYFPLHCICKLVSALLFSYVYHISIDWLNKLDAAWCVWVFLCSLVSVYSRVKCYCIDTRMNYFARPLICYVLHNVHELRIETI